MAWWLIFIVTGLAGGVTAGLFGIGGGVVILPMLIYMALHYRISVFNHRWKTL